MSGDSGAFSDAILEALEKEEVVSFRYLKKMDQEGELRILSPWQINCQDCERPVLLGWDHMKLGIRQFYLDQIRNANIDHEELYVPPLLDR